MDGCIGALDGWLVHIICPSIFEVLNPGKYYSRKGFYAINVQVIVDKNKRVLWRNIGAKGSSHDSPTFHKSGLGEYLASISEQLRDKGLYLVGDSAYALRSYLLTPYDDASKGSEEDSFNFFLSSKRIYVECAFGEIDRRWGIFWKPLEGSLYNHKYTIDSALRLHNFIVEHREEVKASLNNGGRSEEEDLLNNDDILNEDCDNYLRRNPLEFVGIFGADLNEDGGWSMRGRVSNDESQLRQYGKELRDILCGKFKSKGLTHKKRQVAARRDQHNRVVH
jgi:hypothetical protein